MMCETQYFTATAEGFVKGVKAKLADFFIKVLSVRRNVV